MVTFEVGQKVRFTNPLHEHLRGKVGTITYKSKRSISAEALYMINYGDVDGYVAYPWELTAMPEIKQKPKLIVYLDNTAKVHAKYIQNGKTVAETTARCHPDDKFNFLTGAQVAIQRLVADSGNDFVFPLLSGSRIVPLHLDTNENKTKGDKQNGK
jgi:hypothetical protein